MQGDDKRKAQRKYNKKAKRYYIDCYPSESDLIAKLEAERDNEGYVTYIKNLIRADIAKSENK